MATIRDVAKLAGVGVGTVSRVLSGKGSVAQSTTDKVMAAMAQLEYRPSSVARSLSSRSQGIIGLWLPQFDGPFYSLILTTIERELRRNGKHLVAVNGGSDDGLCRSNSPTSEGLNFLIERDCDGIILCGNNISDFELAQLDSRYRNLVLLNRSLPDIAERCFSMDHVEGGRIAARRLLEQGHRQIACIAGPAGRVADAAERLQGFREVLQAEGVSLGDQQLVFTEYDFESGRQGVDALLARGSQFSALFCANDLIGMAAISRLAEHGLSVPGDVAIVSYDNSDFAEYSLPRLTSVEMPIEALATAACHKVMQLCYGTEATAEGSFAPQLQLRDSG